MNQAPGFYRYKIGDITLTAINDGFARRPLEGFVRNAELADVKKAMEQAFLPQDALNITFTTLAVQHGGKLTLIDTGNGDSGAPTSGRWMTNFKAAGFDPKDVSTVVFSHFHGDHINGSRLKDGSAVFPNAEAMVPAAEWAFWMDDAKMKAAPEAMKGAFAGVRRVFGPIAKDVKQFEPGKEILPGLTPVAAPGHTPGHTVFALCLRHRQADDHVGHNQPPGALRAQPGLVGGLRHGRAAGCRHPPQAARHGFGRADAGRLLPCALPRRRAHRQGRERLRHGAGAMEPGHLTGSP
ncbi:hypothetical protein BTHI11S_01069 [Bosea thiooxidans]